MADKKWVKSYQPVDKNGRPVGPPQKFEADTQQELIDMLASAHQNASVKLYETRRSAKLGDILEPDPEEPIETFEPRQLTAEELVKVEKLLANPATAMEAHRIMMEAQLGASLDVVRAKLRDVEIKQRVEVITAEVEAFKAENPEYVECDANNEAIKKYMEKNHRKWTRKNIKIAFEDLLADDLIVVQAPKAAVPVVPAPVTPVAVAPSSTETIPPATTQAAEIPPVPEEVRPAKSSSGLGRNNSTAAPGGSGAPKAAGISIRDINRMSAAEYAENLKDPEFKKQVDALYAKK